MRRQIAPYSTRIVFDYSKIYGPTATVGPFLMCVSIDDLELIRKLLGYAKRRINWAVNLTESGAYYNGLLDSEFEDVIDHIQDLEGRTMGVICTQDLVDAINAMASCVCEATAESRRQGKDLGDIQPYIDEGTLTVKTPAQTGATPTPPATATERCEYAQAVYYQVWEAYTEYLFPFADQASDVLLAALVASAGFTALAGFVGLPIATAGAIVGYIIDMAIDSSIENFTNWLLANKDELVCELYLGLPSFTDAAANVRAYVDSSTEISFLDKQVLNLMIGSEWWIRWVIQDQETNDTWRSYFVPGQCDDCDPVDPECLDFVGDSESNWFSSLPPAIRDNEPTCPAGQVIWHTNGSLVPTSPTNNRWEFTVVGKGGVGTISYTIKLRTNGDPPLNFQIYAGTVEGGEVKEISGTFNTTQPGEVHFCQFSSSPYYTGWRKMCIRPPL